MVYSLKEASSRLGGVHESTLRRWIADGRIEALKLGRRVVITDEELRRFVAGAPLARAADRSA